MAKRTKDAVFLTEKRCAKCGKTFIAAPYHIYKKGVKWYCSWTCYNHRNDAEKGDDDE
jgi:hypothetical protein